MDGFGSITWWGFSPAIDLQSIGADFKTSFNQLNIQQNNDAEPLNILLCGAGDCRHVFKTIAKSYRYRKRKINFYVLETSMELYARDILFLSLVHESPKRMGLKEKAEYFLELFGNSLVRSQALEYVEKMANEFIKYATNADYLEKHMPLFDLSLLKFKERDMLEAIFKFWRTPITDVSVFDIAKAWDLRIRKYLGVRYDAIPNVFDWDYNMKLVDKEAGIINGKHYCRWRHKGFAFEIREGAYDRPNKTLASGMIFKHEGDRLARRGYWGDIIVGPYISLGIECEEKRFFKKNNNLYVNSSQEIAEYNLLSMCHEISTGTEYVEPTVNKDDQPAPEKQTATLTEITEEEDGEEEEPVTADAEHDSVEDTTNPLDLPYEAIACDSFKVHFLPLLCSQDLYKKSKYQKLFNIVYMSNSLVHNFTEDLSKTFADDATVILETSKYMLELNEEQSDEFRKKIIAMAEAVGCKLQGDCNRQDNFAKFHYTQRTEKS